MINKHCSRCRETKPAVAFSKDKSTTDGRQSWCKQCRADYMAEKRTDPATRRRYNKRCATAARRKYMREYLKKYQEEFYKNPINKERHRERSRQWMEQNRDRHRELCRRWSANNPDRTSASAAKRRAAKAQAVPKWCDLAAVDCIYASRGADEHVDHIVPLINEIVCGLHCHHNLTIIPASQNQAKGNRFDQAKQSEEYLSWLKATGL